MPTRRVNGPVTLTEYILDLVHERAMAGVAAAEDVPAHGPEDAALMLTLSDGRRYRVAVTECAPPATNALYGSHKCAGAHCPGLPYKASERPHPGSCT